MKKFYIGIFIVFLAAVGFILWHNASQKAEPPMASQPLRIGLNPWIGNGLYYVAKEKGFFEKEHINVALENFDDSAIGKQLLNTDKIDMLPFTPETAVVLADAGVKIKIVGISDSSQGADGVIASKDIKTIADLKGKKVAFEVGSPSHFFLSYFLDQHAMTTNDVAVINQPAPDAGATFVAGKVDAAVTWEPWLSKASERRGGHLLISSKAMTVFPDYFIFREEFIKNHPHEARAFLRAFFNTEKYSRENQDETIKIIAKNFKITEQEVKDQLPTFRWLSFDDNVAHLVALQGDARQLLQIAGDLWLKLGLIKTKINANDLVDISLLKNLYQ